MSNWREKAECRAYPELFFDRVHRNVAGHICRSHCPVIADCREWAVAAQLSEVTAAGEFWTLRSTPPVEMSAEAMRRHNPYCRSLGRAAEEEV